MEADFLLDSICADLPSLACTPGCVECCTVALWSRAEWRRLPEEHKGAGKGLLKVPMRINGNRTVTAYLPVPAQNMLALANRKKMAVTKAVNGGLVIAGFGLDKLACLYRQEGIGCTIYDYRPFTCRIMGASNQPGPLHCPQGLECSQPLPETVIMQRFLLWTNLFERDPRYGENK